MASRPLAITLLVLGAGITIAGAIPLMAPQALRDGFAPAGPAPTDPGPRPELPAGAEASVGPHSARLALATMPRLRDPPRPVTLAKEAVAVAVAAPKAAPLYAGDAKAMELLAEAEKKYRAYAWDAAVTAARGVESLDARPGLKARGREIAAGAPVIASLFKHLDERDELTRSYETHPSLVRIETGREFMYALPIRSLGDRDPVVIEQDPLGYIAQARTQGKVPFLIRGRKDFIATTLQDFGKVSLVDQRAAIDERRKEFSLRVARLEASSSVGDALAWYEAGKFAYRNRLDEHVVEMLDRAVRLDPRLLSAVREDKAASLFANMMAQLSSGNRVQAESYMAAIERKYKDTEQGKQARLFFDGRQAELIKATEAAAAKAAEAERQRQAALAARLAEARKAGDSAGVRKAEAELAAAAAAATEETPGAPLSDEDKVDQTFAKGREIYARAIELGNTNERDEFYTQADKYLSQAVRDYSGMVEQARKGKDLKRVEVLQGKLQQANQLLFGARKYRRFH
jgi:hypothetical protein